MNQIWAEIITIGDEILYGQITDTNSQWISAELDKIGIKVIRKSSIRDDRQEILNILAEAEKRASIIITTGGLGPTKDDITKRTIAEYFDRELEINEIALAHITKFFEERGREMLEVNVQQATIPKNSTYIHNAWGTAPGIWIEKDNKVFMSMPGIPYEMKNLMRVEMLPRIQNFFQTPNIFHKIVKTFGLGESFLAEKIKYWEENLPTHIKLAYLPNLGKVRLRLTATGANQEVLEQEVSEEISKLIPLIEKYVYGYDNDELEEVIAKLLLDKQKTIATAESCTGGYLAHAFTQIAGSSAYYLGGVVSYSNESKIEQLGIDAKIIEMYGAVSEETVKAMAENVRQKFGTDIAVATSGIAGPGGGTAEKPVGTIWIAYADANTTYAKKLTLLKERIRNIHLTTSIMLDLIRKKLLGFL